MAKQYQILDTQADRKTRWGGLLENPHISTVQRNCLDYGRVQGLKRILDQYYFDSILDVGCGYGEMAVCSNHYVGLDNVYRRVQFAASNYSAARFLAADARALPFKAESFDAVMMVDTSHHLIEDQLVSAIDDMARIARRYIVISDPILFKSQSSVSSFFYDLDRGACFRNEQTMRTIISRSTQVECTALHTWKTFPGIYVHGAYVLRKLQ